MIGMDVRLLSMYTQSSELWFSDHTERPVSSNYLRIARRHLRSGAKVSRNGGWLSIRQSDMDEIDHGWKIHVSATPSNADVVLDASAAVFARHRIDFKFQADELWLTTVNGRMMPRGNGCKFITAYPGSELECKDLLDALYGVLESFKGPRILSDRRYRDCEILHYRYGGHRSIFELAANGSLHAKIRDPESGFLVDDPRPSYWSLPRWVGRDPFCDKEQEVFSEIILNSRYRVEGALRFTNSGGIYIGLDLQTDRKVLIKEARQGTDTVPDAASDAIDLRRNEWEVLNALRGSGIAVDPVDFFIQEDHAFLVVEYLEGAVHLQGYSSGRSPLGTLETGKAFESYLGVMLHTWSEVAVEFDRMHRKNLVYGDLSMTNVMLVLGDEETLPVVRLVDFESTTGIGRTDVPCVITPGFSPLNLRVDRVPRYSNDVYALGMLMVACLGIGTEPCIQDPRQLRRLLDNLRADLPLPIGLLPLIEEMTAEDPDARPSIAEVRRRLGELDSAEPELLPNDISASTTVEVDLGRVVSGIEYAATPSRDDRCYASDPMLYQTNPFSVAYGVAGVMRAMSYLDGGGAAETACSWLLQRNISPEECPPGLYIGIAGVAWVCLEAGLEEYARDLMTTANHHSLVGAGDNVFDGDAGLVLANLRFWDRTGETEYAHTAVALATRISEAVATTPPASLGFAGGLSGVATSLLYAGAVAGESALVQTGLAQIRDCIAYARPLSAGYRSMPASRTDVDAKSVSPYWVSGTAGVGGAALRFAALHPDEDLLAFIDDAVTDASRKWVFMPGYMTGLAGLGDFLLDVHAFTGRRDALTGAHDVASGLAMFAREEGPHLLFPGTQLARCSADFATGAAGVAMFLQRLQSVEAGSDPGPVQLLPDGVLQLHRSHWNRALGASNEPLSSGFSVDVGR